LLTVIMVIGQLPLAAPASAGTEVVPWERWLGHYDVAATGNTLRMHPTAWTHAPCRTDRAQR